LKFILEMFVYKNTEFNQKQHTMKTTSQQAEMIDVEEYQTFDVDNQFIDVEKCQTFDVDEQFVDVEEETQDTSEDNTPQHNGCFVVSSAFVPSNQEMEQCPSQSEVSFSWTDISA